MIEYYIPGIGWRISAYRSNLEEYITDALTHTFNYTYRYRKGKYSTYLPNGK